MAGYLLFGVLVDELVKKEGECVNALLRASLISTYGLRIFARSRGGVNALLRASLISILVDELVKKEGECVNALLRASLISTAICHREFRLANGCQCPSSGFSHFYIPK